MFRESVVTLLTFFQKGNIISDHQFCINFEKKPMDLSKLTLEIFSSLEKKWLSQCQNPPLWPKTRILSIDGDASVGDLIAGDSLVSLEDHIKSQTGDSGVRIADFFDLIAGTGLGGVLAAMLVADDGNGRPLYSASEAVKLFKEKRSEMFKPAAGGIVFRRRGRLSGRSLDGVLREAFLRPADGAELTLKDTCKPLLVPCYDLNSNAPFVFSHADAKESPSFNFHLWKVGHATSATPGKFKPAEVWSEDGKTAVVALDGGLVMNNPAAAAVTHVLHNKRQFPNVNGVEDIMVLSLGNGGPSPATPSTLAKRCSMSAVVGIAAAGVSETVEQIIVNAFAWNRNDYLRIQANGIGKEGGGVLEEAAAEVVQFGGKRLLKETNGERLEVFVRRLVTAGKSLPPSPVKKANSNTHQRELSNTSL